MKKIKWYRQNLCGTLIIPRKISMNKNILRSFMFAVRVRLMQQSNFIALHILPRKLENNNL